MRVTDRMIFEAAARNSVKARERMDEAVQQTSTGKRMAHVSDDPAAAGQISASKLAFERLDTIRKNTGRTSDEIQVMHNSLLSINEILDRARVLAVQFSNDTFTAEDRAHAAQEIDQLSRQVASTMNVQFGSRYLFGGFRDNVAPFDQFGNYSGDTGVRQLEIAPGVYENVSVRADVALKGASGGVDVFNVLSTLKTALQANDRTGVSGSISDIDTSFSQVAKATMELSGAANILSMSESVNLLARDEVTAQISRLADADIMESATNLALANRALEAALSAAAKSFELTLVNRLR